MLDRIKLRAAKYDMNIQQLAAKTGISANTIYSWNRKTPRSDKLGVIAKALHTSTEYLRGETDDPEPVITNKNSTVDLDDDETIFTYQGKPIPPEDMKIIKRLLNSDDE